jgi:uncharacterized protein (DUF2267 family)
MANKPTAVNQALSDAGVVVQVVEAPKAEYVVSVSEAQQIDITVDKFIEADELLFEGDVLLENTARALAKLFGVAPSYAQWNTVRQMWIRKYMGKIPQATEDSTQKCWERLTKRMAKLTGLEKPKAPSKAAQAMSAKRAESLAKLQAMSDDDLVSQMVAYVNGQDFSKANEIKKEITRRTNEANKGKTDEVKAMREQVIKQIKQTADLDLLRKVSAMLPKLVMKAE